MDLRPIMTPGMFQRWSVCFLSELPFPVTEQATVDGLLRDASESLLLSSELMSKVAMHRFCCSAFC
jgi:hypothetical protein